VQQFEHIPDLSSPQSNYKIQVTIDMYTLSYTVILFISLVFPFLIDLSPVTSQNTTNTTTTTSSTTTTTSTTNITTTTTIPPITVTVFTPLPGDVVGFNGGGWVVDLALYASSAKYNYLLSPSNGYKPAFLNPLNSTQFHAGNNSAAPGLVCLFNTTPTVNGSLVQGPQTNLAGFFQINGVAMTQKGTIAEVWNTWYLGGTSFANENINMTVYVVNGTAPSLLPTGTTILPNVISNVVTVAFSTSA